MCNWKVKKQAVLKCHGKSRDLECIWNKMVSLVKMVSYDHCSDERIQTCINLCYKWLKITKPNDNLVQILDAMYKLLHVIPKYL